jgi:LPXTG-motif cell wall-anchored protein
MKRLIAVIALALLGSAFLATPANADEIKKVYVCKYVKTPGTNEVQKNGSLIFVSVNAVGGNTAIGSVFSDQHGLSVVVATDQDPAPDESICVLDETPPPTDTPTDTPKEPEEGVLPNTGGSDGWLLLVAGLLGTAGVATLSMRRFIKE